jgi:hypothetical protein
MENYKLRVRIGDAEFEAEGPEATVKEQFAEFQKLVAQPVVPRSPSSENNGGARVETDGPTPVPAAYEALYDVEERGRTKHIKLRFLPTGDRRDVAALLLVLLGYKVVAGLDRVRVTTILDALRRSGLPLRRIDRVAEGPQRDGLLLKGGTGKGGTYALTVTGQRRAEAELGTLHQMM